MGRLESRGVGGHRGIISLEAAEHPNGRRTRGRGGLTCDAGAVPSTSTQIGPRFRRFLAELKRFRGTAYLSARLAPQRLLSIQTFNG